MTRLVFGVCLLATPAVTSLAHAQTSLKKPNIILIFVDDVGFGDLGSYGSKLSTPAIDKLATEGFRSTDCLVAANVCGPSRAALMTGRYPMRCGHPISRHNTAKYEAYGLAPDELTMAELLKENGYHTKMVGKWHLGFHVDGSHPLDAGFDEYLGLHSNYSDAHGDADTLYRDRDVQETKVEFEKVTKLYTDEIVNFIKGDRDKPFFIYFSHHIAHNPILPSKPFQGKSKKEGEPGKEGRSEKGRNPAYGDFMLELDHSVGRVMAAVKETKIDDNTLVVFLSDNGPARFGSAKPLTGGKYVTMEGGHRVPAIFHWRGRIPAGEVSDAMITSMDLLPLFCHLANVALPTDRTLDGKNIIELVKGETKQSPHEAFYYYNGLNLQAIRAGKWKLHLPRTLADQPYWAKKGAGVRKPYLVLKQPLLFDLDRDIGETNNVFAQHPEVVSSLMKRAEHIRAEIGDVQQIGTDQRPHGLVNPNQKN